MQCARTQTLLRIHPRCTGYANWPSRIRPGRLSSTTARCSPKAIAFASFFFPNEQWKSFASSPGAPPATRTVAQAAPLAANPTHPAPTPALAGYKQTEVLTPRRLLKVYTQLSKSRLTTLVVLTAMVGVALSPLPVTVPVLLSTAIGTTLCSASANTFNQIQEVPFDAQMARTRMRPLVRRAITPLHAAGFAVATGVAGPVVLWTMVNPATALLGLANIALYAGAYTWMKRTTIWNTWVGSVVGAIPPLMGWTACGGHLLPSAAHPVALHIPAFLSSVPAADLSLSVIDNPLAPFALFMLLFSWQFPHFNPLSHLMRESYAQGGYRMLSVVDPSKNARVSLRHSLLLIPICSLLMPISGLTTWAFALTSLVPNIICARAAWSWWRYGSEKQARALWHNMLWYLPVILGLLMFHKRGMEWTSWLGLKKTETDADATTDEERAGPEAKSSST
ncbi:hypothetical protein EIP86_000764 [Pleurotus ostreatoroseus]|nr:hypothetical protein EIP86_000764 [Pleurotus ostreatoroseus]